MNYGQTKCFFFDLIQWRALYKVNFKLSDTNSAKCLTNFAVTVNDTTSAAYKKCCSELLTVYSSVLETLAHGAMKTITLCKS